MTSRDKMKFAELLCSKLCHDLISPIGAINNGLEFLTEDSNDMLDDATKLIASSARQASDRLTYFRMALGVGGSDDTVAFEPVLNLVENLALEKKLGIVWVNIQTYVHSNISKLSGKLLLNLALIAFDCLPRGGNVEITIGSNSKFLDLVITVDGDKCNLRDDVKLGLSTKFDTESLTIRNVLAFYCANLVISCQKTLWLEEESPSRIIFRVS
jgi:histidine phosphotransferase ChpT